MNVVRTAAAVRAALGTAPRPIGLVPTMGSLHEGHLSLVRAARRENPTVVATVFVNPTQFGPEEDYASYPRDLQRDTQLLRDEQVDLLYIPEVAEMYPPGFDTVVAVGGVSEGLEGAWRPSHFRGVATVVTKLFNTIQPDHAYFGQKDAQQVRVIRKLVVDLNMAVDIRTGETVREPDGLALSSRNGRLSDVERHAAAVLSRALRRAEALHAAGERSGQRLRDAMREELASEPLARPDYVSVADGDSLRELDSIEGPALLSLAVRIGDTRLIDNLPIEERGRG